MATTVTSASPASIAKNKSSPRSMQGYQVQETKQPHIACGFSHSVAIFGGDVYVWGKGEVAPSASAGPLGPTVEVTVQEPQKLEKLPSRVVSVHCGSKFTLLLHESGGLTSFAAPPSGEYGSEYFLYEERKGATTYWGERMLNNPTARVVKAAMIACGSEHILMVDNLGRAYSWGTGVSGALGHGNLQDCAVARQIAGLKHEVVISIAAGARHSLCCTAVGDTYSWGNGENAKLGLKDGVGKGVPTLLETPVRAVSVACGESHSALISKIGELFVWGAGAFGRLGLGFECGDVVTPTRVDSLWNANEIVSQVSLGMLHSACITVSHEAVTSTTPPSGTTADSNEKGSTIRKLYVWGSGSFGKLGISNSTENQLLPIEPFPRYMGFSEVRCGASHTMVSMETGEILCMGMEGAPWLGKRKKDSNPVSLSDFFLEVFVSSDFHAKVIRKSGYGSSNQTRVQTNYIPDIDDTEWPNISEEEKQRRDCALETFATRGLLPTAPREAGKSRIQIETVQHILWSQPWNGDNGVSETSLQASRDLLAEKRYHLRVESEKLKDLAEDIMALDKTNGRIVRSHMKNLGMAKSAGQGGVGLGDNDRAERELNKDFTAQFSFRGFNMTPTTRTVTAPASYRDYFSAGNRSGLFSCCFPSRAKQTKKARQHLQQELEDREFFTGRDFNAASTIMSYLLANPDRMFMFWSATSHAKTKLTIAPDENKVPELFAGLCRDLYDITDKRSERLFQKLLKSISTAALESEIVDQKRVVDVNTPFVYKDGIFCRLIGATYLSSPPVASYFAKRLQPFIDAVVRLTIDLDFDPFTIATNIEASKKANSQAGQIGGLVYLKAPEEQLPLDIREANAKRRQIYDNKPDVRRALEPKFEVIGTIIEQALSILCEFASSLPLSLGDAFYEYYKCLLWSFTPREDKETCTLALFRTLFHSSFVPILTHPGNLDKSLSSSSAAAGAAKEAKAPNGNISSKKSPISGREILFNLNQVASLIDQCFICSKTTFDAPWFGPLQRIAKDFRTKLMNDDLVTRMQTIFDSSSANGEKSSSSINGEMVGTSINRVARADIVEGNHLKEIVTESLRSEPLVLYPTRRTLEFLRHRVAPFLSQQPNVQEVGQSSELILALEHFDLTTRPPPTTGDARETLIKTQSRRKMFAAARGLSRSRSRLFAGLLSRGGEKDREEEEKRINYFDFSDDWGYTLPTSPTTETVEQYLSRTLNASSPTMNGFALTDNEGYRTEATEVISRATELLVSLSFQPIPAAQGPMMIKKFSSDATVVTTSSQEISEVPLWSTMLQHMPDFETELAKYATGVTQEEKEWNFACNILEKILVTHVERVQARTSLTFKNRLYEKLLLDVKQGVQTFTDRKTCLEQYQDILHSGNEFSQNRKAIEYFAEQAELPLTEVVIMSPDDDGGRRGVKSKASDGLRAVAGVFKKSSNVSV